VPDASFFPPLPEGDLDLDKIKQWVQNNVDTFRRSIAMQGELFSSNFVSDTSGWRLFADGDAEFNGDVTVGANGSLSIGGDVPVGASSQFFIHAPSSHIVLIETDDSNDNILNIDQHEERGRIFWQTSATTFFDQVRLYGPDHATQASDIELYEQGGDVAYQWDESAAAHIYSVGGSEVARFEADAGHNLQGLAWTTWTPTPTNFAVGTGGNAGITARYVRIGDLVTCQVSIVFGTTGNSVSGSMIISLPFDAVSLVAGTTRMPLGQCIMGDAGVAAYGGQVELEPSDSGAVRFMFLDSNADGEQTNVATSSTLPFAWNDDDWVTATFVYEAA
jgi:hypothetical protein